MIDFVTEWSLMLGIFLVTGAVFQATKTTVGAEAGDKGAKGVFFVWGRTMLFPLGALCGWLASLMAIPAPEAFGESPGAQVLAGIISSGAAGLAYNQIMGVIRRRIEHKGAKPKKF